ncbi:adhesion G protein-coupled receptor L4 isoform X13 [Pristis pectinata]|uniref:adhesion G protein-coupled receptor L4 isoform X1 n=1 Tax=Pristis pectinata TaxID=685728 RepID=UPI00223CCAD3|nr:adhesion G protein-coupled receptor L4 isoform X1 [Pristis pectinata]XP_051868479.1 adhesion G protein-coupled receptor L4 isoform X2 [Pristis pectinata]XP_051868481.1 adhesion G protein-coupled receptor L4 isoform X3 [Pristis pectinata]XP_051868482.1 adhesion G protein-coupled receptor L4 isoform X4 [Pristis pectinata]XP_051868483.1 adhesion G protein-coupled receptor L4 isoform X5 [Pristis pectinata]XP_051868484.1 adhesion G protein-coupled receptor L4 isoform X6 [Pristis pectinata]XP_05
MKFILLCVWLSSLLDLCSLSPSPDTQTNTKCKNVECNKNASCTVVAGKLGCYCKAGFTGDGVRYCEDDDECQNSTLTCGQNATCNNTYGSYYCTCVKGYQSSNQKKEFIPNDGTTCHESVEIPCYLDSDCLSGRINDTLQQLSSFGEPQTALKEIAKNTTGGLTATDVLLYVEVLLRSTPSLSAINETLPNTTAVVNVTINAIVKTVNNLLKPSEMTVWNEILEDERKKSATKLLHTMEMSAISISQHLKSSTELEFKESDIALKLYTFDLSQDEQPQPQANLEENHISISRRKDDRASSNGTVAIIFLQYNSIGLLLEPSNSSQEREVNGTALQKEYTVNSPIIAAAVRANPPTLYLMDHVTFTMRHLKPLKEKKSVCVFWNYSILSMEGEWDTRGCESLYFNATHTTCRCNHLTNFAVLMSSSQIREVLHNNILTRITQLGIIVSLICLSMCIFTFCFFSEIQSTRTTIHKNLCFSLFIAELLFLTGINMNSNKLLCSIVAGLLHYFFLAAFAWMCIEGIHLYLIVVGVIYNKGFLHRNFYIFGYGSPSVVVGISALLGYKYYGTDKICWLSTENNFIWSFIGPACLIILVNLLAFGVIIYKVFRHTSMLKPEVSCYENIRSCARGALALLFLLGATWTFGVLHIIKGSVVTAYLFTISNAFQGMFIFVFLCILSKKIQKEYYRLLKNVPCCFEYLR